VALGHSNKLVAYTLGLTVAAAGNLVARAAHKLGARSRVELIEQYERCRSRAANGEPARS
jgi:DNA-binding CsgD family transcriptional regulator